MIDLLTDLAVGLGFVTACIVLGAVVLPGGPHTRRPGLVLLAGLAAWSAWFTLFGWCGAMRAAAWLLPALLLILLAMPRTRHAIAVTVRRLPRGSALAAVLVAAVVAAGLAAYPPYQVDATTYHLPLAAAHAATGRIDAVEHARYPAFPQLVEVAQSGLLLLGSYRIAHLVGLVALVAIGLMLADLGRLVTGRRGAALGTVLFVGAPQTLYFAPTGYVDVPMAAFATGAVLTLARASTARHPRHWLICAALCGGCVASVKYTGLAFTAGTAAWITWITVRRRTGGLLLSGAVLAGAASPWFAWNLLNYGDPIAPFGVHLFGSTFWNAQDLATQFADVGTYGMGSRLLDALLLPVRLVTGPGAFGMGAPMNPLIPALGIPAALCALPGRRPAPRIAASFVLAWLAIWFAGAQVARYLFPVVPAAALLATWATLGLLRPTAPARLVAPALRAAVLLGIVGSVAYGAYRVATLGPPPLTAAQTEAFYSARFPTWDAYRVLATRVDASAPVYGLFDERMKLFAGRTQLGDWFGRDRFADFERLPADEASAWLAARGVDAVVVDRRVAAAHGWDRSHLPAFHVTLDTPGALLLERGPAVERHWQDTEVNAEGSIDVTTARALSLEVEGTGMVQIVWRDTSGTQVLLQTVRTGRSILPRPDGATTCQLRSRGAQVVRAAADRG